MTHRTHLAGPLLACLLLAPAALHASADTAAFAPLFPRALDAKQELAAALGARLFDDERLSDSGERACSGCHRADTTPAAAGRDPTSLHNVSLNARFGWTGRFATLAAQVEHELRSPERLGASPGRLLDLLRDDPAYRAAVAAWRGREPDAEDVGAALAAHLRTLLTPGSDFDRYLAGEATLSADAVVGFQRFRELGCATCHQGVNLGGNLLQRIGLFESYGGEDRGREMDTGRAHDRYVFRVPGLRNVAHSAPYFHDGSRATLADAIADMGRLQLLRELSAREISQLRAFLESLSAPVLDAQRPTP